MTFSGFEFAAIIKMAKAMAFADGKVEKQELSSIVNEMQRFGVNPDDADSLLEASDRMETSDAVSLISKMDLERKQYVAAFLGAIMAVDMEITDSEMAMWSLVSELCKLPTMSVRQALEIMTSL
ncbi:MAG: TerB family tellurite resistance protein [Bacteroidetes bacterium]|uniref:TerB family tellurite resistance protein n=1 Tax=Candidatus Cryptobacteroides gallistercoris TaxID=2840765 RepID=A0A940DQG0_9BACT|nr:TerB family tellurite resistance protein [Candidatus Cryptobacteroides gallistercoris]